MSTNNNQTSESLLLKRVSEFLNENNVHFNQPHANSLLIPMASDNGKWIAAFYSGGDDNVLVLKTDLPFANDIFEFKSTFAIDTRHPYCRGNFKS